MYTLTHVEAVPFMPLVQAPYMSFAIMVVNCSMTFKRQATLDRMLQGLPLCNMQLVMSHGVYLAQGSGNINLCSLSRNIISTHKCNTNTDKPTIALNSKESFKHAQHRHVSGHSVAWWLAVVRLHHFGRNSRKGSMTGLDC